MNAVSQRLKDSREAKGLTVPQAAAMIPVSRSTWFRWETGVRKIGASKLPMVAKVVDVPAKELRPDLAILVDEAM